MKYFLIEEIPHKLEYLQTILDMPVSPDSDVIIIKHHMIELMNAQSMSAKLYSSAKYTYLKDKKNPEYNVWYTHAEQLNKEIHYKLSALQSVLRLEMQQEQLIRNGR